MTAYDFGDIILVPFPFTDQTASKRRPAVVVRSSSYHRERPDVIIMAVTSQARPTLAFGELPVTQWKEAGLLKPSVVKPVLTTLEKKLIVKTSGRLSPKDQGNLKQTLNLIIA
jgi:mRNA interferase MazF